MNILVSYNWLKEYVRTKLPPEEFAARLSLSGPSVERIHSQGENLENIVVGEIMKIKPHPNADKLRIAETSIGREMLSIICGGTNLREGMKVAVARLGARVRWHGEGELVELKPVEIRGVKSEGMICAANEIGLFDYFPHADREILDLTFMLYSMKVEVGRPLREALGFDDVVFDVEVTTNRPDAFSVVGLAREASAILGEKFLWKPTPHPSPLPSPRLRAGQARERGLGITIEAPKLCRRYQAAVLKNVQVKPSPWWMQRRLLAAGIRPISNIVDITNYVMLELGQPMHVFDADRLKIQNSKFKIQIRLAQQGEAIKTLDGQTYSLGPSMLVIADAKRPIAIAGVMGGEETGVTKDTTDIIFESANFDPVSVRRTARALNLHSDSSLRFEKGLSTESTTPALARAVELAIELADATLVTPLLDKRVAPYRSVKFPWDPRASAKLIGLPLATATMKQSLTSLGFDVHARGKKFQVSVPYWRDHDIESSNDFNEEIARIYGYHKLPSLIPGGPLPISEESPELKWEDQIRESFRGTGFTEVYSYSFVSEELLKKAMIDTPTLKVQNPLTADFAVMRPSLIPSHLEIVAANETEFREQAIFEVANVYIPRAGDLPHEVLMVGGAIWGESPSGELFFKAKGAVEMLASRLGVRCQWSDVSGQMSDVTLGHPGRRAALVVNGHAIGVIGEVHPAILLRFGIKHRLAVFSFDLNAFCGSAQSLRYESIPEFPPARRDISFFVPRLTTYEAVVAVIEGADHLLKKVELFDIFEGRGVPEGKKSMAFHLTFAHPDRTLTGNEVDTAFARVVKALESKCNAEVRMV